MSHTTNAGQQPLDDDTREFAYAGVGARQAPPAVLDAMARITHALGPPASPCPPAGPTAPTTRSRPARCARWRR